MVGTKLLYGDGSVQHGGMLLQEGHAGVQTMLPLHVLRGATRHDAGYLNALSSVRNYQAVTGALMASRREVFLQVGGFDEVHLPVEFNDVDYCLRVRKAGYRVLVPSLGRHFSFRIVNPRFGAFPRSRADAAGCDGLHGGAVARRIPS